jgi:hypothetical protein
VTVALTSSCASIPKTVQYVLSPSLPLAHHAVAAAATDPAVLASVEALFFNFLASVVCTPLLLLLTLLAAAAVVVAAVGAVAAVAACLSALVPLPSAAVLLLLPIAVASNCAAAAAAAAAACIGGGLMMSTPALLLPLASALRSSLRTGELCGVSFTGEGGAGGGLFFVGAELFSAGTAVETAVDTAVAPDVEPDVGTALTLPPARLAAASSLYKCCSRSVKAASMRCRDSSDQAATAALCLAGSLGCASAAAAVAAAVASAPSLHVSDKIKR